MNASVHLQQIFARPRPRQSRTILGQISTLAWRHKARRQLQVRGLFPATTYLKEPGSIQSDPAYQTH